ncbi:hypothetical protein [Litoribrevibacter albus]|uniref:Uncharacterized protein n=1 Tax=Litoribrevibacter albus TaxID=1473156 RepID=A0AA37SC71_9GAMM|nr:hypothetical protein [Litoribrevibacter albus]GLQ31878.1 hypothetical protein GCM10007876_23570 [Litoribrevibacter albus]
MDIAIYRVGEELFLQAKSKIFRVVGRTTKEFRFESTDTLPEDAKRLGDHHMWAIASKLPDELINAA